MINDELLEALINGFYGYGNYQAPYWFVGMEESGGNSIEEIAQRIETWDKRGRKELEDVAEYSREIGINRYFDDHAKLQSTWNKLIRVVLTAEGLTLDTETVREFGVKNSTRFVVSNHPVTTGIKNEYFHNIGKLIAG